MGVLSLIVKGSVPAEVIWLDVHSGSDFIAVGAEQVPPHFGIVISKTHSVLTLQGENMRPHIPVALIQFLHGLFQIHCLLITKEPVVTEPFRARPGGNVLHVAV